MGVVWLLFHVVQFLPNWVHRTKLVLHQQIYDGRVKDHVENLTSVDLVMIINSACL